MISYYKKTLKDPSLLKVENVSPGSWIHVFSPEDEELDSLSRSYNLERDLLSDALDTFEVPRMELEENALYIFTRFPTRTEDIATRPVLIILHTEAVFTVCSHEPQFVKDLLNTPTLSSTTQKIKLILSLLFAINKKYKKAITHVRKEIEKKKTAIKDISEDEIISFIELEERLQYYLQTLAPSSAIFKQLIGGKIIPLFDEDLDMVEDLKLSNEELIETTRATLKTIKNIRDTHSLISSMKLNKIIKQLTIITLCLTIPNVITSFYGMNIPLPLQEYTYFWLLLLCIISTLMFIVYKKYKKR